MVNLLVVCHSVREHLSTHHKVRLTYVTAFFMFNHSENLDHHSGWETPVIMTSSTTSILPLTLCFTSSRGLTFHPLGSSCTAYYRSWQSWCTRIAPPCLNYAQPNRAVLWVLKCEEDDMNTDGISRLQSSGQQMNTPKAHSPAASRKESS